MNERSRKELDAAYAAIQKKLHEGETSEDRDFVKEASAELGKMTKVSQAKAKAALTMQLLFNTNNMTRAEQFAAVTKCLDLFASELRLDVCKQIILLAMKHPTFDPLMIVLEMGDIVDRKRFQDTVEMAEILSSLEFKEEKR